jgi:hypothetical protein
MKQEFHLILGIDEFTDSIADALFQAGFDDAQLAKTQSDVVSHLPIGMDSCVERSNGGLCAK